MFGTYCCLILSDTFFRSTTGENRTNPGSWSTGFVILEIY